MAEQRLITKSLLTKIADAIRSKMGTTKTYTPEEMATAIGEIETGTDVSDTTATASGVVDGAIFYTADGTRTEGTLEIPVLRSLTPSNSLPQAIYEDYKYIATGDGVAVESISSVKPSNSSPAALGQNGIYQPSADGYAISSYSSITPSNSSPVSLASGSFYTPSASGYAISSYTSLTPPTTVSTLSSGSFYKMASTGYCISSYSSASKSPSSSGTSFSAGWNYMNSSGYAYSSQPSGGGASGSITFTSSSTSAKATISTGLSSITTFHMIYYYNSTYCWGSIYDSRISTTTFLMFAINGSGNKYIAMPTLGLGQRSYWGEIDAIDGGNVTIYAPSTSNMRIYASIYWEAT